MSWLPTNTETGREEEAICDSLREEIQWLFTAPSWASNPVIFSIINLPPPFSHPSTVVFTMFDATPCPLFPRPYTFYVRRRSILPTLDQPVGKTVFIFFRLEHALSKQGMKRALYPGLDYSGLPSLGPSPNAFDPPFPTPYLTLIEDVNMGLKK
jgi:hypothetical protein